MSLLICRVCLNENLKMHNIADDKLRQIFAKLASCELNSDDGMPTTVCYICVSQLRRCRRFFDMVNESTRALTHLLHNGIEISTNNLTGLTRSTTHQLTMKTLPQISLLDSDLDSSIAEVIQEEVVVKGEPTENDDLMDTEESKRVNINANNPLANVEPEQDVKNETANDFFIEIEVDRLVDSDSGPKKPKDSEISLYCDVCDNLCTSKTELITHLRIHSEEKRYACERCRKSFDQAGALEHHMLIHIGEKTYPCNICNKTFTRTDHLKRHMLIHTGKKPFICEVCEKAFVQAGDLKRHLRVHTGEKPYSCKYCCKTFRFAGHSRLHMRTHTGEKPFVCMYCDKKFNVSGNLKHHIQTQHSDKHNPVLIFDQPNQP